MLGKSTSLALLGSLGVVFRVILGKSTSLVLLGCFCAVLWVITGQEYFPGIAWVLQRVLDHLDCVTLAQVLVG